METLNNVNNAIYSFDYSSFDDISLNAKDFVEKLLVKEPSKRMSAKKALAHEWFNSCSSPSRIIELSVTKTKLKRYVIRRRWRKVAYSIMFLNKLNKLRDVVPEI